MSSPVHDLLANHESIKTVGDIAAATITLATLAQWLPVIAAVMSIVWYSIRIYDWFKTKRVDE